MSIIVVVGPTASGKSDLAVAIAKKIGRTRNSRGAEIISADSRQVYRGLDLGSGKITPREMRGVPHHLLSVAAPRGVFTAARYRLLARRSVRDILRRGETPIVVGGTGLYIDALLYDSPLPEVAPDFKLRARLEKKSTAELFVQLKKLDPRRAENIDQHNKRRLVRAIEIVLKTGAKVPKRSGREGGAAPFFEEKIIKVGINLSSEELKKRIRARLSKRLKQGMLREVANLHENGLSWKRLDSLGLEYRYASRHLRGMITHKEMIAAIEKESWAYARRQMTWWRKDKEITWTKNSRAALVAATKRALS